MVSMTVTLRGPFFTKKIDSVVLHALEEEVIDSVLKRWDRTGKGLGARRNKITQTRRQLVGEASTTLRRPRVTGRSWRDYNIRVGTTIARNKARKSAKRIMAELS